MTVPPRGRWGDASSDAPTARPPRLIALSDCQAYPDCPEHLAALCREAPPGEVLIIVRDRQQSRAEKRSWAAPLAQTVRETGQWLSVADDLELMHEIGADGVHCGSQARLPTETELAGIRLSSGAFVPFVTRSGHGWSLLSDDELRRVSGLLLSPVWQERKGRSAMGSAGLGAEVSALRARSPRVLPYALGGVQAEQVVPSLEAGAYGVACIGAVMTRVERERLLEALRVAVARD